jgi:hypothetical protein
VPSQIGAAQIVALAWLHAANLDRIGTASEVATPLKLFWLCQIPP